MVQFLCHFSVRKPGVKDCAMGEVLLWRWSRGDPLNVTADCKNLLELNELLYVRNMSIYFSMWLRAKNSYCIT